MVPNRPPPKLQHPHEWSPEFNDFVSRCLVKDPAHRPRAIDLLTHPFVQKAVHMSPKDVFAETIAHYLEAKSARLNAEGEEEEAEGDAASTTSTSAKSTEFASVPPLVSSSRFLHSCVGAWWRGNHALLGI